MMYSDEILSTGDVALRYNVAGRTVQAWIADGLLPARRIAGVYLIFRQDLVGFEPPRQGRPPKPKVYHSDALGPVTIPED